MNKLLNTDSYKLTHFEQLPPDALHMSAYVESRGVADSFPDTNEVVHVGTNAFVKGLETPFTADDINEAASIADEHGVPFNVKGFLDIYDRYGGYFPVKLEALPEGTVVPIGTCQAQIMNTDSKHPWLPGYLETDLLRSIWYPSTVATLSREIKKVFKHYLNLTADSLDGIDFMLHDFGARGASSLESSAIGGSAHLINFKGSDTLSAIPYIRRIYGYKGMPCFSVPAAEHSTITSWNEFGGEEAAFSNMIQKFGGEGKIYAVVSDSYDIWNAVENLWGGELREEVLTKGGRLVVRPDSGKPKDIVLGCLNRLGARFGFTINSKGNKVLHPSVRVIQGDGVNYYSIADILGEMSRQGWSAENVVFGMGGALLQKLDRDSLKYAMKASAMHANGVWHGVYKDPVTDPGKRSKRGLLMVRAEDKLTIGYEKGIGNLLKNVYECYGTNPTFVYDSFEDVRARAAL